MFSVCLPFKSKQCVVHSNHNNNSDIPYDSITGLRRTGLNLCGTPYHKTSSVINDCIIRQLQVSAVGRTYQQLNVYCGEQFYILGKFPVTPYLKVNFGTKQ